MMRWLASAALAVLPVPAQAEEAPICTDRPTKANAVCTVPVGKMQLESTAAGWSLTQAGATRTELLVTAPTVVKFGLSDRSDLQIAFTPFAELTVKDSGSRSRASGFGDVIVRYKHRLTADGAPVQVAAIPFATLPTAGRDIGNRRLEGGVAVPVSVPVGRMTVTLGPEVDFLADGDGHGRHVAIVNIVNISSSVAPRLTVAGELWSNMNFDPARTIKQASADVALAFVVSNRLQLDMGANAGLTSDTPDIELYAGASVRF